MPQPEDMLAAAVALRQQAAALAAVLDPVGRRRRETGWTGPAADRFDTDLTDHCARLARATHELGAIADRLNSTARASLPAPAGPGARSRVT